jgi:hypothetical protein
MIDGTTPLITRRTAMTPQELLLVTFCLIDDELKALGPGRLRQRGPAPTLSDAEVITLEIVGEAWGHDTDKAIYAHFRRYHLAEFPALARVSRTSFARQAANLWRVKERIWRRLADGLAGDDPLWLVDSLPIDACQFARASFCRRFQGEADYGYDHLRRNTYYGFRLHLRVSRHGVIMAYRLSSARVADAAMVEALDPPAGSTGVGDRRYWDPALRRRLAAAGVTLRAPYVHKSKDPDRQGSAKLASVRYRIETVNGQLAERFDVKRTWTRDLWHLIHRVIRKILGHTVLICLTVRSTIPPLSFDRLMAA